MRNPRPKPVRFYWASILLVLALALAIFASAQGQEAAPGWSTPVNLSHAESNSHYPNLAIDPAGGLHVIWSEGDGQDDVIYYSHLGRDGWTEPVDVLMTPGGAPAYEPFMAADARGYLHVVWRGGGAIFYSSAYAPAAGSAHNWSAPVPISPLEANAGNPHLVVDRAGILHVVFAQSVGANSGIYYIAQDEEGSWQGATSVFANSREDRLVGKPRLAIGAEGTLHVVWMETAYPNTFPPLGIRYARSTDGGKTWSRPYALAEGPYDDAEVIVRGPGEVHVVWSGTAGDRFKFHRWSSDGGRTWSEVWRNTDLGGIQGWPALVLDGSQKLHWLMVGSVFSMANDCLYYTTWDEGTWSPGVVVLPGIATTGQNPAFVSAGVAGGNELHVVLVYPLDKDRQTWQTEVFYLHRHLDVPAQTARPLPDPTRTTPTAVPTVRPTASPAATAVPRIPTRPEATAPPGQGTSVSLLLLGVGPAAGIVALFAAIYLLRQGRRNRGH